MSDHWLTRPRTLRRLWAAFIAVLALTVLAGLAVDTHPHFGVERLFAFNAVYGFLACAALILVAKALGLLLKRRDTYYDD
ncbi:MAG TPA: hypothetical protein VFP62_06385 [Burkholderiales bacterium]|jgi:hypothetical protein|nr:hypothetical protein [Burkholderiales bacterium]